MPSLSNRIVTPLKKVSRPTSDKIIFISCEGQVTEEEYFEMISNMFDGVKSKIRFISVMEEAVQTPVRFRTPEQISELGKNKPLQLVKKIDKFKEREQAKYQFDKHPEDEFWIIADVEDHTNEDNIEHWNQALNECDEKGYGYAISNPFFEIWLLLHHTDPIDEDYKYAITLHHAYEKTSHFRHRLRDDAKAPLKSKKHIDRRHYQVNNVKDAIVRAKSLHNKEEKWPRNLGTTVYMLIDKIVEISDGVAT